MREDFDMHAHANAIAFALGPLWTVEPFDEREDHRATLRRTTDGLCVFLHRNYRGQHKATPMVPHVPSKGYRGLRDYGVIPYNSDGPEAGYNPNRPPEAIAKAIMARVVKPYEPLLAEVRKKIEAERQLEREVAAFAERIGAQKYSHCSGYTKTLGGIHLQITEHGSIHVEGYLDFGTALLLCDTLAKAPASP